MCRALYTHGGGNIVLFITDQLSICVFTSIVSSAPPWCVPRLQEAQGLLAGAQHSRSRPKNLRVL